MASIVGLGHSSAERQAVNAVRCMCVGERGEAGRKGARGKSSTGQVLSKQSNAKKELGRSSAHVAFGI